jgi:hypothetical protein
VADAIGEGTVSQEPALLVSDILYLMSASNALDLVVLACVFLGRDSAREGMGRVVPPGNWPRPHPDHTGSAFDDLYGEDDPHG